MSPRPGGESDKFGNRYEGAWTVRHLLYILNGDGDSITVEDTGDLADSVEFTFRRPGAVEVHQVKRQLGLANSWTVKSLHTKGIWEAARHHAEAGREFHFVSTVPARVVQELCDFARRSGSLQAFIDDWLNKELRAAFDEISALGVLGSPEAAWKTLRKTWFAWPDERDVVQVNAALSGLLLEGATGLLAAVGLGDLVVNNLGVELTAASIVEKLPPYGLRRVTAVRIAALVDRVKATTVSWSASIERELLTPAIPREETAELVDRASSGESRLLVVSGAAGSGKSAILYEAVKAWLSREISVLGFRLDRLEPFSSTTELGNRLDLAVSPVSALAAMAGERPSLLVIDQLDAVSLASGRMPLNFDVIADLIREAAAFGRMRVILVCRKFDIDNDDRIRQLTARSDSATITVASLSDEQVNTAVQAMRLDPSALTPQQMTLLRAPLHLVLLATIAREPGALDFQTTGHLFAAYWDHKRRAVERRRSGTRFSSVICALAEAISARQRLSVPVSVLDRDDLANDADVLVSEHVLVRDGREIAFFHEAFFDYAFARQWVNREESLVNFLVRGEQELFRRAQVRQIMNHLRDSDLERFVEEVRALLTSSEVRFHIKDTALAVLGALSEPTVAEAEMLLDVAAEQPPYEATLWSRLRNPAWFTRLDTDGYIARWLKGGDEERNRALNLMAGAVRTVPVRLAELLSQHSDHPDYPAWLRWVVRFAELPVSRPLFELFLDAIRRDLYTGFEEAMWLELYNLPETQPGWVVEVLQAFLVDRPDPLALDKHNKVLALKSRDHSAAKVTREAAEGAPQEFCDALLPYMLQVIEVTDYERTREGPRLDLQFSFRDPGMESDSDLDDALFAGMTSAIRSLATANPEAVRPTLERLAADPHDSAQFLLYQGLLAGGAAYAGWAADLLLESRHRLLCGYASNSVWLTRQVLQTITPLINDEQFGRLEGTVRDLRFPWEGRPAGWYAFTLLSGMKEDRLSEIGRRRLGELRRAFGMDQPPEPAGVVGGFMGPPIPREAAPHMNDDNWLQAMARHSGERENFRDFIGGAREQSHVLKEQVVADPARFASLALRLTPAINPAYGDAILMGLGDAEPVANETLIFDAVRHIASLGQSDNDLWLGHALQRYFKTVPLDLVELLRDRALASSDPNDDAERVWSEEGRGRRSADLYSSGINTARGSLGQSLGNLLVFDTDGSRTALVAPVLNRLAKDHAIPVRICVAHTIGAALRFARTEATTAFGQLIEADDVLLATDPVLKLIIYLGNHEPTDVLPTLDRMLASSESDVRIAGGQLAAVAALEWGAGDRLEAVLAGTDSAARQGAAHVCAHRLPQTSNAAVANATLMALVDDSNEEVRKAVAEVAGALRGHEIRPFEAVIKALLASQAFGDALPQLLITLERAPDRVNDIAVLCAGRFAEVFGADAGDIRTRAAADAREVATLIIRGLAQSRSRTERAELLDALDELLLVGAYGVDEVVGESERQQR